MCSGPASWKSGPCKHHLRHVLRAPSGGVGSTGGQAEGRRYLLGLRVGQGWREVDSFPKYLGTKSRGLVMN